MNEIRKGKGVVIFFKVYADYGFIFDEQYPDRREDNVFYHTNSFDLNPDYDEVKQEYKLKGRGTKVIYEAEKGDKGWAAISVELAQEELDTFGSELTEKEQDYIDEVEKETLDVVAEEEETVEEIEEIEEVEIENQEGV